MNYEYPEGKRTYVVEVTKEETPVDRYIYPTEEFFSGISIDQVLAKIGTKHTAYGLKRAVHYSKKPMVQCIEFRKDFKSKKHQICEIVQIWETGYKCIKLVFMYRNLTAAYALTHLESLNVYGREVLKDEGLNRFIADYLPM